MVKAETKYKNRHRIEEVKRKGKRVKGDEGSRSAEDTPVFHVNTSTDVLLSDTTKMSV